VSGAIRHARTWLWGERHGGEGGDGVVPGTVALHEYDLVHNGTDLKYVGEREAAYRGDDVSILARNEPPEYKCEVCGAPATQVCSAVSGKIRVGL